MNPQYGYTKEAMESICQNIHHISLCASACVLLLVLIVITLTKGK